MSSKGTLCVLLRVRLIVSYFKQEDLTRESFTSDGWFKTGDVGQVGFDALVRRL